MNIDQWWANQPHELYWMEITNRADLGADLFAPQTQQGGKPYWGYELLTHVMPGDIVLHWHKTLAGEPSIVGWSRATGTYEETTIEWRARGTVGRAKGSMVARPAWRMPLEGYVALQPALLEQEARRLQKKLMHAKEALQERVGSTSYFPFAFSDKRELRAQQTYLVKMPEVVLEVLALESIRHASETSPPRTIKPSGKATRSGSGYMADVILRTAIEWRAVNVATSWYETNGYEVQYVGGNNPYDLIASRGGEVRRIEVKGSTCDADSVELTMGEVKNAKKYAIVDLFVLDNINFRRDTDGTVDAFGGSARRWPDWEPSERALDVTRYRYRLPAGVANTLGELPGSNADMQCTSNS